MGPPGAKAIRTAHPDAYTSPGLVSYTTKGPAGNKEQREFHLYRQEQLPWSTPTAAVPGVTTRRKLSTERDYASEEDEIHLGQQHAKKALVRAIQAGSKTRVENRKRREQLRREQPAFEAWLDKYTQIDSYV